MACPVLMIHCHLLHFMKYSLLKGSERRGMGSAFHQLCPRYSGTLTPTAPTAHRLWETFTFYEIQNMKSIASVFRPALPPTLLSSLTCNPLHSLPCSTPPPPPKKKKKKEKTLHRMHLTHPGFILTTGMQKVLMSC